MTMKIITNNQTRGCISGYELSEKEREEFSYYTREELENAIFFRYKGRTYDLCEFMSTYNMPAPIADWDGYSNDSFFSGILIKWDEYQENIIVATYRS